MESMVGSSIDGARISVHQLSTTPEMNISTQIAQFDPSKGIFDALEVYHIFYELARTAEPKARIPKLVICGHGSVDDPDAIGTYHFTKAK